MIQWTDRGFKLEMAEIVKLHAFNDINDSQARFHLNYCDLLRKENEFFKFGTIALAL